MFLHIKSFQNVLQRVTEKQANAITKKYTLHQHHRNTLLRLAQCFGHLPTLGHWMSRNWGPFLNLIGEPWWLGCFWNQPMQTVRLHILYSILKSTWDFFVTVLRSSVVQFQRRRVKGHLRPWIFGWIFKLFWHFSLDWFLLLPAKKKKRRERENGEKRISFLV